MTERTHVSMTSLGLPSFDQYFLPKISVISIFAAQNVSDINICRPKCQRHQYLLPKMSVTFPLSILSGNRLPLCLPRSWQAAQLFCSASLIFCPATFAFGLLSILFWYFVPLNHICSDIGDIL